MLDPVLLALYINFVKKAFCQYLIKMASLGSMKEIRAQQACLSQTNFLYVSCFFLKLSCLAVMQTFF